MNFNSNRVAAILAGALMSALLGGATVRADDNTAFGQPTPNQFLLNKMFSAKSLGLAEPAGAAGGQKVGADGKVVGAAPADPDEDGDGAYPKRYLLNRMFGDK
jgi:hypothetical protein